jgi:DNA-binding NarL/FixJ family response regulator
LSWHCRQNVRGAKATKSIRGTTVTNASSQHPLPERNLNYSLGFGMSSIRVLVVEDFAPFRQFIRSTLGKRPDLQIICEVADGLEAVGKAAVLKPNLVLLDIGLPTLNGIQAARHIRKVAPESKIIFVSQESSADVVQEALELGAWGYVVKARSASDLLLAVEAVIREKCFVGTTEVNS